MILSKELPTSVHHIAKVYGTRMKFERVKIDGIKGISGCRSKGGSGADSPCLWGSGQSFSTSTGLPYNQPCPTTVGEWLSKKSAWGCSSIPSTMMVAPV